MKKITLSVMVLVLLITSVNLFAQLPITKDYKSPFVDVVKNIRESVVNIKVEFEVNSNQFSGQMPFNDDFFKFFFPNPNIPKQSPKRKSEGMGSGFIFKRDGKYIYIITNNHVAEHGQDGELTVTLADKEKYKAEIVGLDKESDLAVIKIKVDKSKKITVAPLGNSDNLDVGDWAIAIGNPFGQGLDRTVTVGIISAKGRSHFNFGGDSPIYQDYIQTDAAINPGNSGGPLVNIKGEVIGVNAAITTPSRGNVGIGFAIPINLTRKVVNDLMTEGKVIRAYLGILPQEIDSDLRKSLKLDEVTGVLIAKVEQDTPAEHAGLKKGDVIVKFNNKDVPNVSKFRIVVADSKIGVKTPITIIRKNKEKKLFIKLIERPEKSVMKSGEVKTEKTNWLGLDVESLNGDFAKKLKIEEKNGVIITNIEGDSPAANSELRTGDIILEVNNQSIKTVSDYKKIIRELKKSDSKIILFYVTNKNGGYRFVPLNLK